ncbi:hypothetical protein SDC9_183037 [bioreactor metagenome]|uniref:Uncharacterized protein n=1 Tax=bioreactor metagenome TaxID=1076179 RepID=A0A645HBN8_9ZZZZ
MVGQAKNDFVLAHDSPDANRVDTRFLIQVQIFGNAQGRAGNVLLVPEVLLDDFDIRVRYDFLQNLRRFNQEINTQRDIGRI